MILPTFRITSLFTTPIVETRLENPAALNQRLTQLFLSKELEGARWRKRVETPSQQVNIFESEFDLFNWTDESVQELRSFCLGTLGKLVMEINHFSAQQA